MITTFQNKLILTFIFVYISLSALSQSKLDPYNVVWTSQSKSPSGSMPLGNGDIGANLWVDEQGQLCLYISKTDAFSEIGRLLKVGKVILRTKPQILNTKDFNQTLKIEDGLIQIEATNAEKQSLSITCLIDANRPVLTISGKSNIPLQVELVNAIWRTSIDSLKGSERRSAYGIMDSKQPIMREIDSIISQKDQLIWVHQNKSSIWQSTLDNQNISEFNQLSKDPLLNQNFGAIVSGTNFYDQNNKTLLSKKPLTEFELNVAVLKTQNVQLSAWRKEAQKILKNAERIPFSKRLLLHKNWWADFWNQHYILITAADQDEITIKDTYAVSQGYLLQRYMNACAGRGGLPIKFNGSIFNVDVEDNMGKKYLSNYDADFRDWGANYWFQNTRLPYYSMLYSGDFQLMKPLFDMYLKALPLAKYRTQKYFNHAGAYFPETMTPWGTFTIDNYGWDRSKLNLPDGISQNKYIRYVWEGSIELSKLMIDYYEFTNDQAYFKNELLPFIKEIVIFYNSHYQRDTSGKISIQPAQSLETYFEGVINPLPEVAGLHSVLDKLVEHEQIIADKNFMQEVIVMKKALPEVPTKQINGSTALSPGYNLGERTNIEKPELYAVFPYRVYGLGKDKVESAILSFNSNVKDQFSGWQQDAIFAAYLGLTEDAKRMVTHNFNTKHTKSRFPAFWGPNYDWVPDQDHGTVNMRALQNMLVQSENNRVLLFPAWPKNWNVEFKMHVQGQLIIQGNYDMSKGVTLTKGAIAPIKYYLPKSN